MRGGPWTNEKGEVDVKRRRAAYAQTFAGEQGAKVLNELRQRAGVDTTSHVPNNPYQTAFNEGMRHLILEIERTIKE
jgi:hypothetical protein